MINDAEREWVATYLPVSIQSPSPLFRDVIQHCSKPGSAAFTRTTLLSRNGPIKESIPFLESSSRQFCSLRLVQSGLDCSLFCCKGRYVFGFLQVVLYQLKLSAPCHVRVIGHARLAGQFFGKKKKKKQPERSMVGRWSDIVQIVRWRVL